MLAVFGMSTERLVHFSKTVDYVEFSNRSNQTCDSWVCTSDSIFAVALLVNLGKLSQAASDCIVNF